MEEAKAAPVCPIIDRLDARHGPALEERHEVAGRERGRVWEVGGDAEHRLGGAVGSVAARPRWVWSVELNYSCQVTTPLHRPRARPARCRRSRRREAPGLRPHVRAHLPVAWA